MKIKNIFKRIAAFCLCAVVMLSVASCTGSPASTPTDDEDEEVSLHILEVNNNYFRNFTQAVKNSVPDMPLDIEYYSGSNPTSYINQKLVGSEPPDIIYFSGTPSIEFQQKYLLDISSYDFLNNYNLSLVNQRDVNGAVYMVPANYSIYA